MGKLGEDRGLLGWDPPRNEAGNYVVGPPRILPRKVRGLIRDRSLDALLLSGQPMLGYSQWDDRKAFDGTRNVTTSSAPAPTVGNTNAGDIGFRFISRSGGGSKERVFRTWGSFPMHHILDPGGAQAGWTIIAQDLVDVVYVSGTAWVFWGFWGFNTSTDETSLTGVGWWASSADDKWTSGVYDGTGTPSTTLHETEHASLPSTTTTRLAIELSAEDKAVYFYANGALVDTFTPSAALGQMTNCPTFGYHVITEAAANCSFRHFGGGNPRIITYVPVV